MKKLILLVVGMFVAGSSLAADFGISVADSNRSGAFSGITVGQKWGKWGSQIGVDLNRTQADWLRYSFTASYDMFTVGRASFNARAGMAYIDNQYGRDGYASLVGFGVSVPVTKTVAWTADWAHQAAQDRIRAHSGNELRTGLKFAF